MSLFSQLAGLAQTGAAIKTWTAMTATGSYTVPAGVTSIRAYAFGKGGDGSADPTGGYSGAGGGCAYGDIAVTPGSTVSISISSGVATVTYGGITMLTANPGANAVSTGAAGGTATRHASVTNGGAFAGGNGSTSTGTGGASSGSPLGAGSNGTGSGGSGWGGVGGNNNSGGGGGGGAGGAGATPWTNSLLGGAGGGAGGAASSNNAPGPSRAKSVLDYADPLLVGLDLYGPGAAASPSNLPGASAANGGGGGGAWITQTTGFVSAGHGGSGGGGGSIDCLNASGSIQVFGGNGGFGAGGGSAARGWVATGGNGGFGGGGGSAVLGGAISISGTGGPAIVLIYA